MADTPIKSCAIYTRKSSEEGLEQDYNSLDAQREACEAFIKSQASEGWRLVKTAYNDGGFSGGTIERPGLQQLLGDIRESLIDVVVVYKVDRLTRSLADFAKMVELFDAQHVSFVAVTQQFNTTTSMGRLTLNVLLSFAQFEREVIGERIRDKVAASKRKGMWMGGTIPMGYDLRERKLVVNHEESRVVKLIFERYLEIGSVRSLKNALEAHGVVSAVKVSKKGSRHGGKPFSRGALYHLLSNPIYVGEVKHKRDRHPGQHEPVISRELWNRVQERLRSGASRHEKRCETEPPQSPLAGKLFDERGEPLYVQGAAKGRRRYRYYVSRSLVRGESRDGEQTWRLPAPELERSIAAAVHSILSDRAAIALVSEASPIEADRLPSALASARRWAERLRSKEAVASAISQLVERVGISSEGIRLSLKLPLGQVAESGNDTSDSISLQNFIPMRMKRRGVEMRMVLEGDSTPSRVDLPLLRAVARARRWSQELLSGEVSSVRVLARREGIDRRSIIRLLQLWFLSPRIVEAIAEGRQPPDLSVTRLTRLTDLPLIWSAQEQALGVR
jgi:site-specific DNA recombinase